MAKVKVGSVWDFSYMQNDTMPKGNYEVVWQRGSEVGARHVDSVFGFGPGAVHIIHSSHFKNARRVR
jgi:hypothetical protein